jgi:hypothetical protein
LASINTGKLFSRSGKLLKEGNSISELRNKHWRSLMEDVQSRLARIGDLNRRATLPDPSPTIAHEIDNERNEIIKRLNEIWTKLAIPVLALPTDWQRHSDIAAD